jgi:BirA family biotin operon repressor/biotin-[acetyl-CoA-carboxylase] ligase
MTIWTFKSFAELPSTQDTAIAAAQAGEHRVAVLAERQTAGRGRGGRLWQAPAGNLNLSLALRPGPIPLRPAEWSLLAGVALFEAVAATDPGPLMLKWPNDLLMGGAKLAGVLIDSALTPAGLIDWVVIGIGVNLAEAPTLPDRPTICLGRSVTPVDLAHAITRQLDHYFYAGPAAVRAAWLARAHAPGTMLRVHDGARMIEGIFEGLADDGSLMLSGHAALRAGDVFLVGV